MEGLIFPNIKEYSKWRLFLKQLCFWRYKKIKIDKKTWVLLKKHKRR